VLRAKLYVAFALRGLIALQQGKPADALQKLEPALSNEFALPGTAFFARYRWVPFHPRVDRTDPAAVYRGLGAFARAHGAQTRALP